MTDAAPGVAELVGMVTGLLLIAAGTRAVTKRLRLPFSVTLVLVGIALAALAEHGPHALAVLLRHEISPEVIMFVFLPTLIFESAFNLNFRQLRHNLLPVLVLAIPGLLLSTTIIGLITWWFTSIDLAAALLLGAILSATDPVAVISLFKQLGAPKRLTVLVEGESLFNDATAIVLSRILIGIAAAGYFSFDRVLAGAGSFLVVFFGGIAVGCLAAWLTGLVLGRVEGDVFIEISLTTILAYFSFLIAEEIFHVSGVMATVAAGVTIGNWGRSKISPSVTEYLEQFWEYLTFVGNALIFLLVGLRVDPGALARSLDQLVWVVLAMLLSRAVVVFGLVPLAGRLPGTSPVSSAYQAVMFWGGLRGAIALAIVLSLEDFAYADTFIALVMGAVLFSLLVQGLSMEKLVRRLGLDRPLLADRVARSEGLLAAMKSAMGRIPVLQTQGLFSAPIAREMERKCSREVDALQTALDELRSGELDRERQKSLLYSRCFAEEKAFYYELFGKGHLSERAYRDLSHSLDLQEESLQSGRPLPAYTLHPPRAIPIRRAAGFVLERAPWLTGLSERINTRYVSVDYEEAWGRCQGCSRIIEHLEKPDWIKFVDSDIAEEVLDNYRAWFRSARDHLDTTAAQFPEFARAMQENLARRLIVNARKEVIESESRAGIIPPEVAEKMIGEMAGEIRGLRGGDRSGLRTDPSELLRKVPFFQTIPREEFDRITSRMLPHTVPVGEVIIRQGHAGDSLFLISRGVIRVSLAVEGKERDIGTMMPGDFFGEMALLHHQPRSATCRAVTPAALYELRRSDFEEVSASCPSILAALQEADRRRSEENSRRTQGEKPVNRQEK